MTMVLTGRYVAYPFAISVLSISTISVGSVQRNDEAHLTLSRREYLDLCGLVSTVVATDTVTQVSSLIQSNNSLYAFYQYKNTFLFKEASIC